MPQIVSVIFDNCLSSQNQDYLPSRYVLQKEVIDALITNTLENDPQSLIGLIPIAQKDNNDVLTPTQARQYLSTFLHQRDLFPRPNYKLALYQAKQSLSSKEAGEHVLFIILGSPIPDSDQFLVNIYNLASEGFKIRVVCFADAYEFGSYLSMGSNFENLAIVQISPEEDFNSKVAEFFANAYESQYIDQDLEEAIRRSMAEK